MCILLATRAHPDYDLILISNRDEFLQRRTHATKWNQRKCCDILCPYDMSKCVKNIDRIGTWCGVNENGRISTVLNLKREDDIGKVLDHTRKSRGNLPIRFLDNEKGNDYSNWNTYDKFFKIYPDIGDTGDFNLLIGDAKIGKYNVLDSLGNTYDVLTLENPDLVISNDEVGNHEGKWKKIIVGESLLKELVDVKTESKVMQKCFEIASTNTVSNNDYTLEDIRNLMTETILVPPLNLSGIEQKGKIGASLPIGEYYGTRSQMVVLINKDRNKIKLVERVIFDCDKDVSDHGSENPMEELVFEFKF